MIFYYLVYAVLGLAMLMAVGITALAWFLARRLPTFTRMAVTFAVAILMTLLAWSLATRVDKMLTRLQPANRPVFE